MTKGHVLITDVAHPCLEEMLSRAGFYCDYLPEIDNDSLARIIHRYTGIIVKSKNPIDAQLMDLGEKLSFIGRIGSGLEVIDLGAASVRNIAVYNSPEGNCNAVAEHALAMLLTFSNNLVRANVEVRNFSWQREKNRGFELRGKTVGIIGVGNTGSSMIRVLQGLGVYVLAYDKYKTGYTKEFGHAVESNPDEILEKADVISFHLQLTTDTMYMGNLAFFDRCKKGCLIINTSRGRIVNTMDLIQALQSGHLAGACLDVMENENPASYTDEEKSMYQTLFSLDQVIVTPHIAGWSHEAKFLMSKILAEKVINQIGNVANLAR